MVPKTASGRLQRWAEVVAWLEAGPWQLDPNSYDNDLAYRCALDAFATQLTGVELAHLAGLDARFMQLTQPSSSALICGHDEKRDDWWLHRVPAVMTVSAFEQFRAIGYL